MVLHVHVGCAYIVVTKNISYNDMMDRVGEIKVFCIMQIVIILLPVYNLSF